MTEKEARTTIENAGLDWADFDLWMAGQTVGLGDNGEIEALELVPYNLDRNKADGPQHYDMAAGYDDAVLNLKFKIAELKEREGL